MPMSKRNFPLVRSAWLQEVQALAVLLLVRPKQRHASPKTTPYACVPNGSACLLEDQHKYKIHRRLAKEQPVQRNSSLKSDTRKRAQRGERAKDRAERPNQEKRPRKLGPGLVSSGS